MSSMKDKMHTGELYLPGDEEIMRHQLKRLDRLYDFNMDTMSSNISPLVT